MTQQLIISDHAFDRFIERHATADLGPDRCRELLRAELERGVLVGAQVGDDELYLLPCGDVAAVARDHGVRIVKTVLTYEHAIANMQSVLRHRPRAA